MKIADHYTVTLPNPDYVHMALEYADLFGDQYYLPSGCGEITVPGLMMVVHGMQLADNRFMEAAIRVLRGEQEENTLVSGFVDMLARAAVHSATDDMEDLTSLPYFPQFTPAFVDYVRSMDGVRLPAIAMQLCELHNSIPTLVVMAFHKDAAQREVFGYEAENIRQGHMGIGGFFPSMLANALEETVTNDLPEFMR